MSKVFTVYAVLEAIALLCIEVTVRVIFRLFPFVPAVLSRIWHVLEPGEEHFESALDSGATARGRGYPFEEHIVRTSDGFLLVLHRIPATTSSKKRRPVVLLQHGFMMSSEIFLVEPDSRRCLPLMLADAGVDVWLGNARGNKYSCQHERLARTSDAYWDYSIDELALIDLPAVVDHIRKVTGAPTIQYVGFSQGTAQMFAALSVNAGDLRSKISHFVALAPCTTVSSTRLMGVTAVITRARPELVHLLFGRQAALAAWIHWRRALDPATYRRVIEICLALLFGWTTKEISRPRKKLLFRKIYSTCSVKNILHWFQIAQAGRFQMYDDRFQNKSGDSYGLTRMPEYDVSQIKGVPITAIYGGKDELPDTEGLLKKLTTLDSVDEVAGYEHLDLLWADSAADKVFSKVVGIVSD